MILVVLSVSIILGTFSCVFSQSIVSTNVGNIAGIRKELDIDGKRRVLTEFLGIPYAEDTSGQNRFRKPIPKAPFNETFNAFTISPPCMQLDILNAFTLNMTEDCLMLNIYVPRDLSTKQASELLPVMIFIHGGAFVSGTASYYNGEALSTIGDVIVVTINYRLAEFGFLNVGDSRASGNQGLFDQHLAIKWVNSNIRQFNGDPDTVTIFGESAGAISVTVQSLYAGNQGLFKRVIAESGSAISHAGVSPVPNVDLLYRLSGCKRSLIEPVECLRRLSSNAFLNILNKPEMAAARCCSSSPTIDNDFIIEQPIDIAFGNHAISSQARQFFRSLDIMTGVNNGEGALYILITWLGLLGQPNMNNMTVTVADFKNIAASYAINNFIKPPTNASDDALKSVIQFEYVDWKEPDNDSLRKSLMQLSSDLIFFVPAIQLMEAHSLASFGHSFLYEFTAEPPVRSIPTPVWFKGANHGDELVYVFGSPFFNISTPVIPTSRGGIVTKEDEQLALGVMTAWSNFAKTGGMHPLLREGGEQLCQIRNFPFLKADKSKRKTLAPLGSTFFPFRLEPIQTELVQILQRANRKIQTYLVKQDGTHAENLFLNWACNPNMPVDITPYFNTQWPEYDPVNQRYLEFALTMTSQSAKQHFNARRTIFWTRLIPAIVNDTTEPKSDYLISPVDAFVG